MLLAGAIGCSTVTPPAPSASAVPDSDPPALTFTAPPVEPGAHPSFGDRSTAPVGPAAERGPRDRPSVPAAPELDGAYRFVSAPDFLNQDVADLTADGRKQFVDERTGEVANSTNAEYDAALDHVIDEMASHGTDDVLVAGDLVEGRWGRDDAHTGVFGPVRTQSQRLRAWRRAADVYYPAWRERFEARGLTTYPALGDHEIGDDPWRARNDPWIDFKRRHVPEFKRIYADHMLTSEGGRPRFATGPPGRPAAPPTPYASTPTSCSSRSTSSNAAAVTCTCPSTPRSCAGSRVSSARHARTTCRG